MRKYFFILYIIFFLSACMPRTVRQGEVGVKRKFGKLKDKILYPNLYFYNPFFTKIIKISTRTQNLTMNDNFPSKEGLNINISVTLLYRIQQEKVYDIISNIGVRDYEEVLLRSVLRSAVANVTSSFFAKDVHTKERANIEAHLTEKLKSLVADRGFVVEAVLLKTIKLPEGLADAIEAKLEAEQEAQRMEFVLQRERLEAERKRIEAEGIRDAQKIIADGLTPLYIEWKSLDVFRALANSPSTQIIITDGKTPFLINNEKKASNLSTK
ncbi:MAG: prohibitin family protein [Cytophagales bacterium]|nr:prohibitin family protein [Cytophagales bacterium]MDW8384793.1 prohibitin family protein [Flammeovirgaceae bacterium]